MERNYKAFISYRHRPLDISAAKRVHRYIEHYLIPRDLRKNGEKHPGLVFRDQDELPLSGNLSESIQTALDHSEFLIVICTPDTAKSKWVLREITYFIETHDRDHVLAVLADGNEQTSFPAELTEVLDGNGDLLKTIEPLAANIAAPTERKRARLLKTEGLRLMAALIGCNFDDLYRREQRYKRRRILIGAAVMTAAAGTYIATLTAKNHRITAQNEQITAQNAEITEQNAEIIAQKEQLAEQLSQTQMNESHNLIALSQIDYENGNYHGALQKAYQALPKAGERPFYPGAEAQLDTILNLYRTDMFALTQSIEQESIISGLQISPDGRKLLTTDETDRIRVFDCESGLMLWEDTVEDLNGFYFTEDSSLLVCGRYGSLLFYDTEDGTLLRRDDDCIGCGFLTEEGVYLTQSMDFKTLWLKDAKTGAQKASLLLPVLPEGTLDLGSMWGISQSGKTVALLCDNFRNSISARDYYILIWDTETGNVVMVPLPIAYDPFSTDVRLAFCGEDVLLAAANMHDSTVMRFEQAQNWQLKYKTVIPNSFDISQNGAFNISGSVQVFHVSADQIIFGAGRFIGTLDAENGDILAQKTLSSMLIHGSPVKGGVMLILTDGTLTMYIPQGILTSEANMYTMKNDQNVFGGEIAGEDLFNAVCAMLFQGSKNRVSIIRYLDEHDEQHLYDYEGSRRELDFLVSSDRKLMAGIRYDNDSSCLNGVLIEIETRETRTFSIPLEYDHWCGVDQNDRLLSGEGILYMNAVAMDLKSQTCSLLDDKANATYTAFQCKSAYDPQREAVLTAYLDPAGYTLHYTFSDGDDPQVFPFPDDFRAEAEQYSKGIFVCESVTAAGDVLITRRSDYMEAEVKQAYLFDLSSQQWIPLPADIWYFKENGGNQSAAASKERDGLALLTKDGEICLLDPASGAERLRMKCPIPADEVVQMLFARDDALLFVFGDNGSYYLYDTASGDLLLEENFLSRNFRFKKGARCEAICSTDGKKMVLVYDSSYYTLSISMVIDLERYESLGSFNGINAYLAESNTLILAPYNGYGLCTRPLYSLEEAMVMAEEKLNGELCTVPGYGS